MDSSGSDAAVFTVFGDGVGGAVAASHCVADGVQIGGEVLLAALMISCKFVVEFLERWRENIAE